MKPYEQKIVDTVLHEYKLDWEQVSSKDRTRDVSECRQMIWHIMVDKFYLSQQRAAMLLNRKNHATVISGMRAVKNIIETNDETRKRYFRITMITDNIKKEEKPNYKAKYEKCIEIISRLDEKLIAIYEL